jgi:long-chain fatty acid transport protein
MQRAYCLLILILAAPAFATDGCLSTGYGIKRLGQGGTGVAFPQDSLAAATNPAGMVFAGDRLNLGMTFFRPLRAPQLGFDKLYAPRPYQGPTNNDPTA